MIGNKKRAVKTAIACMIVIAFFISSFLPFPSSSTESESSQIAITPSHPCVYGWNGSVGDYKEVYINNGLLNLSMRGGYVYIYSSDGLARIAGAELIVTDNNTYRALYQGLYRLGSIYAFSDGFGTGLEMKQMLWWTSGLNVSYYFRLYDNQQIVTTWVVVRNTDTFSHNLSYVNFNTDHSYGTSGFKVGPTTSDIWRWVEASSYSSRWAGSGTIQALDSVNSQGFPAGVITAKSVQKSITVGQLTEEQGGFLMGTYSTGADTVYGLATVNCYIDQYAGTGSTWTKQKLSYNVNWTSDKLFIGFTNSNDLNKAFVDYLGMLLVDNNLKSETMPAPSGPLFNTWGVYPRNVTDAKVRAIADFLCNYAPAVKWIILDDGWQLNAGTKNQKDTVAMQVNTTSFPNLTSTVAYCHSKGIKVCLWVDDGLMWFTGAMNTSHPTWRLKATSGSYYVYTNGPVMKAWYADITNPSYRTYLTAQLLSMQSTWGVDGFKLDFESIPQNLNLPYNYNITAARAMYLQYLAIHNGSANADLVMSGGPIRQNPMAGLAFNSLYVGADAGGTFTSLKNSFLNTSLSYLVPMMRADNRFPTPDIDMTMTQTFGIWSSPNEIKASASLVSALGTMAEVSFDLQQNATFFGYIHDLLTNHNTNGIRFIQGQNGDDHNNLPNWFERVESASTARIAFINWLGTGMTITSVLTGLSPSTTFQIFTDGMLVKDRNTDSTGSISISESTGGHSSHYVLITNPHLGSLILPTSLHGFTSLILVMFGLMVATAVVGFTVKAKNKGITQKETIELAIYVIVCLVMMGILIGLLGHS